MELEDDASIVNLAYVILRTIYPALSYDGIMEVRAVRPRGGVGAERDHGYFAPPGQRGGGTLLSILVTFSNQELVDWIIRAENTYIIARII